MRVVVVKVIIYDVVRVKVIMLVINNIVDKVCFSEIFLWNDVIDLLLLILV